MPSQAEMSSAVRRVYDAFNQTDVDALCALSTPDVRIYDLASMPERQTFRGREGIERFVEINWAPWESIRGEVERLIDAGPGRVVAVARHIGTTRDGPEVAQQRGVLVTFADTGKMAEIRFFAEAREALAAAGLDEHSAA